MPNIIAASNLLNKKLLDNVKHLFQSN